MIKPWLRLPFLQWSEENIWHIIAKNALVQSDKITEIYINGLLENLEYASKNYQHLHKNSGYNLQILKSTQKELTMQLFNYVNKNKGLKYKNKQNIAQIQNIMNDSKKIHSENFNARNSIAVPASIRARCASVIQSAARSNFPGGISPSGNG